MIGECHTCCPEKNSSTSFSVRSKAKFPIKAVNGGSVGRGTSSRGGPRSAIEIAQDPESTTYYRRTYGAMRDSRLACGLLAEIGRRLSVLPLRKTKGCNSFKSRKDSRAVGSSSISSAHDPSATREVRSCHRRTNKERCIYHCPRGTRSKTFSVLFWALWENRARLS